MSQVSSGHEYAVVVGPYIIDAFLTHFKSRRYKVDRFSSSLTKR